MVSLNKIHLMNVLTIINIPSSCVEYLHILLFFSSYQLSVCIKVMNSTMACNNTRTATPKKIQPTTKTIIQHFEVLPAITTDERCKFHVKLLASCCCSCWLSVDIFYTENKKLFRYIYKWISLLDHLGNVFRHSRECATQYWIINLLYNTHCDYIHAARPLRNLLNCSRECAKQYWNINLARIISGDSHMRISANEVALFSNKAQGYSIMSSRLLLCCLYIFLPSSKLYNTFCSRLTLVASILPGYGPV